METVLRELVKLGKTDKFNGELDYGAEIQSDDLFAAMREVGTDEKSKDIIETFLEDSSAIYQSLLSICFANFLQSTSSSEPSESLKKSRRAIRLLLNLAQRSPKFARRIPSESVDLLETLLATRQFNPEFLLLLVKTADGSYLEFQKSPRYSNLVERVLIMETSDKPGDNDNQTLIFAYFSTLFEKDYGFLANCYAELTPPTFCALLDVFKAIQEKPGLPIHSNNLLFVINLLELITVDYGAFLMAKARKEPESVEQRRKSTVEMLNVLVEIVGDMCTNTEMTSHLCEKATAINTIVDVLDTILHSEAEFADFREKQGPNWPELPSGANFENLRKRIEEERRYDKMRDKQTDRPKQPPPSRLPRVEASESLQPLSEVFLQHYQTINESYHLIGELKLACLKAIANLCSLSPSNKLATLENGRMGLLSVLQCTSRRPEYFMESYAMRNWCIFCVRQLTDECQGNKEVILGLGEPERPIIDRKRLLKEFGIEEEDLKNNSC